MAILGIDHCNLKASRELLDGLRDFYCSVVGLKQGPRPAFASVGYWLYAGDRAVLHLSVARPDQPRASHVSGTFDHVAFNCENRTETETRLKALNIEFRVEHVPQTGVVQLFLRDPAGNGVELDFAEYDSPNKEGR